MDDSTKGRHLIVTGYTNSANGAVLDDPEAIANLLREVVSTADMQVLDGPHVVRVPLEPEKAEGDQDCGGVTGTVVLSTSHASIHTWPLHGRVSFDLYSCHDFNAEAVTALLVDRIGLVGGSVVNLERTPDPTLRQTFRHVSL